MTLIAEDLLLLVLDTDSGKPRAGHLDIALGGAVLAELALAGSVTVVEGSSFWRSSRLQPVLGATPDDAILALGLTTVAEKKRPAQWVVVRVGRRVLDPVADRLVERGVVERRQDKVLGLVTRRRWPVSDSTRRDTVRRTLAEVLAGTALPDPRTATLVGLLLAAGCVHKVVPHPGLSAREAKSRAREVATVHGVSRSAGDAVAAVLKATSAAMSEADSGG